MKKLLVLTSVIASISASSAFAKTEGNYVGVDVLRGSTSFKERSYDTANGTLNQPTSISGNGLGVGLSYKHAFNFDGLFIAPGVFVEQNNARANGDGQGLRVKNRYGVKADFGYDIADNVAPYFTVGYADISYRTRNNDNVQSGTSTRNGIVGGWFYGVGLKVDVNKDWSLNTEYQTQNFRANTRTAGNNNYSGNFRSNFNEIKIGAAYKF